MVLIKFGILCSRTNELTVWKKSMSFNTLAFENGSIFVQMVLEKNISIITSKQEKFGVIIAITSG